MTNEKMEQIVKLLKDSGEDYILCYPIKIDGEDGCDVCNKSARVYLRQTLDNIIDYVYRVG